jgi:hypothetical protein
MVHPIFKRVQAVYGLRGEMNLSGKGEGGQGLAKGQLWELSHAYIRIVELGKRLIHYKMLTQPGEQGARTLVSARDTMWGYLRKRHAKLVDEKL